MLNCSKKNVRAWERSFCSPRKIRLARHSRRILACRCKNQQREKNFLRNGRGRRRRTQQACFVPHVACLSTYLFLCIHLQHLVRNPKSVCSVGAGLWISFPHRQSPIRQAGSARRGSEGNSLLPPRGPCRNLRQILLKISARKTARLLPESLARRMVLVKTRNTKRNKKKKSAL